MGITPQALNENKHDSERQSYVISLPLNAELDAESTGGKLAERAWDDPKWDEYTDEEDEDAVKREENQVKFVGLPGGY